MSSYDLSFEESDRKLIAVELMEFIKSIEHGTRPEIDEIGGIRATALAYAPLESHFAGESVMMSDVISGLRAGYQQSLDDGLDL
jgi:hypothetical protein